MALSNVWKIFQEQNIFKEAARVFAIWSTSLPPSGQQPALPRHLQTSPQAAKQQSSSSCLPPGGKQLSAPDQLQVAL